MGRYPLNRLLLPKNCNGGHQVAHIILLAHFEYLDSRNKNGYPVDPDICFSSIRYNLAHCKKNRVVLAKLGYLSFS